MNADKVSGQSRQIHEHSITDGRYLLLAREADQLYTEDE